MADILYFTVGALLGMAAFWYIERATRIGIMFEERDSDPNVMSVLCGTLAFGVVLFAWPFLMFVAACISALLGFGWLLAKSIKYLYRSIEDVKFRRRQKKLDTK